MPQEYQYLVIALIVVVLAVVVIYAIRKNRNIKGKIKMGELEASLETSDQAKTAPASEESAAAISGVEVLKEGKIQDVKGGVKIHIGHNIKK